MLAEWHKQKQVFHSFFSLPATTPVDLDAFSAPLLPSLAAIHTGGILASDPGVHLRWWCRLLIVPFTVIFGLLLPGLVALYAHCCFQEMETEDGDYHHLSSKITGLCAIPADVKVSCDWQK